MGLAQNYRWRGWSLTLLAIKPLIEPNIKAANAKIGTKYNTPVCGISHSLTIISCPAICAKAAIMLKEIALKVFFDKCCAKYKLVKLNIAPLKLNTKVGDKKFPSNKLLANTRNKLTQAAVAKPYWYSTNKVTILAMPGFTPGSGDGNTASSRCRPIANAVSLAMWLCQRLCAGYCLS